VTAFDRSTFIRIGDGAEVQTDIRLPHYFLFFISCSRLSGGLRFGGRTGFKSRSFLIRHKSFGIDCPLGDWSKHLH